MQIDEICSCSPTKTTVIGFKILYYCQGIRTHDIAADSSDKFN